MPLAPAASTLATAFLTAWSLCGLLPSMVFTSFWISFHFIFCFFLRYSSCHDNRKTRSNKIMVLFVDLQLSRVPCLPSLLRPQAIGMHSHGHLHHSPCLAKACLPTCEQPCVPTWALWLEPCLHDIVCKSVLCCGVLRNNTWQIFLFASCFWLFPKPWWVGCPFVTCPHIGSCVGTRNRPHTGSCVGTIYCPHTGSCVGTLTFFCLRVSDPSLTSFLRFLWEGHFFSWGSGVALDICFGSLPQSAATVEKINGAIGGVMHRGGLRDPWIHGSMDPGIHGCMDPWMHGSMDPSTPPAHHPTNGPTKKTLLRWSCTEHICSVLLFARSSRAKPKTNKCVGSARPSQQCCFHSGTRMSTARCHATSPLQTTVCFFGKGALCTVSKKLFLCSLYFPL